MQPTSLTPMLSQYLEIKQGYPDCILFYQMGDFFEMFFDDALEAAPLLEVQLTSRDRNAADRIPMCGIPVHALATYLPRLLAHGKRVAVCQQVEDSAATVGTKALVKREVTRVFTPSLVADPELVSPDTRNILFSFTSDKESAAICLVDLLASEARAGRVHSKEAWLDLFYEWQPKEILLSSSALEHEFFKTTLKLFPAITVTVREKTFAGKNALDQVWAAAKNYLTETQGPAGAALTTPLPLQGIETLRMDASTLNALSVIRTPWKEELCLSDVLDGTLTSMGRRRLKEWLLHPLGSLKAIKERHDSVENFLQAEPLAEYVREHLKSLRDLERLATKAHLGLALPKDLVAIRDVLAKIPGLQLMLLQAKAKRLRDIGATLDPLLDLQGVLVRALLDEPSNAIREGGILQEGYHPEIAELRLLCHDAKSWIAALEIREKERTGIASLKVKYSRVFGYTIEVTRSYLERVPKEYKRKQTIANGERYVTEELKTFEDKALTAESRLCAVEESLFLELRKKVAAHAPRLLLNARLLSELDVLQGFAKQAKERGYRRPQMTPKNREQEDSFLIEEGRHPVLETVLPPGEFVPNSIEMSEETGRTWLITGPNMAGKSTIMRQTALIAIMAQAGSFVSATRACLPLFDAIFTRIGSSDDLTRGRSTFMVEMAEVSRIIEKSSEKSLILIDEIGRGTSTYDGLALAWSILEYLHTETKAKTLFATHFHELTSLEKSLSGLVNKTVLVERTGNEVVFLHRLGNGACSRSYGIDVARLAGLPSKVLARAGQVLRHLESQSERVGRGRSRALQFTDKQLLFFDDAKASETVAPLDS